MVMLVLIFISPSSHFTQVILLWHGHRGHYSVTKATVQHLCRVATLGRLWGSSTHLVPCLCEMVMLQERCGAWRFPL